MTDHLTSDGVRIHVEAAGEDGSPTAVLVHGFGSSTAVQWRATGFVDRLTAGGLRVVAFDLRGHGQSDAPAGDEAYGDERMVRDLGEVMAAFGSDGSVVVGYSMGAALVLLALESGLTASAAVIGAAPRAVLGWTEQDEAMTQGAVRVLRGDVEPDDSMRPWLAMLEAMGADRLALAGVLASHRPVVTAWKRIQTPCVFVAGDRDVMAASPAELVPRVAGSRAVTIPGDHYSAAMAPEFVDVVIEVAQSSNT